MIKTIQIYNNTTVDLSVYLTPMFQFFQKRDVTFNYDITNVNVPVPQSTVAYNPLVGNVYVIQGVEHLVPSTDHDITLFFFDYSNWKAPWYWPWPLWGNIPRDDTYMANGKPFITIGYWPTDTTVGQRFIHEPMHALAKIFGCVDQMDTYDQDADYNSLTGNFAKQWAIFKPYLTTMPTIQQSTTDLVESFESFKSAPYQDIAGNWTIGYGFTHYRGIPVTAQTPPITQQDASTELQSQLRHYAIAVTNNVHVALNQNQYDACVSLCYNIGTGGFAASTVCRDINANNFQGAADAFLLWNKSGGKISQGLINRRTRERTLFLTA